MQELFLSQKLSILARDKGFIDRCFAFHDLEDNDFNLSFFEDNDGRTNIPNYENFDLSDRDHIVLAPLYQQILLWFKTKGIRITEVECEDNLWTLTIGQHHHVLGRFSLDTAIEKAFRHVIIRK